MKKPIDKDQSHTAANFVDEFVAITGLRPAFDANYQRALSGFIEYLGTRPLRSLPERRREFLAYVNAKFRLNAEGLATFYRHAAHAGLTFHFHQKAQIQRAFDRADVALLHSVLQERACPPAVQQHLVRYFAPIPEGHTLAHLVSECREPSKLRTQRGARDIEGEIVKAQFSAFLWVSLPEKDLHRYFDPEFRDEDYRESFWEQLHTRSPLLFSRDNALHVVRISPESIRNITTPASLQGAVCGLLERLYSSINNHGFLALVLDPLHVAGRSVEWEVAADATLFAEKHREYPLHKSYFRWERVREETLAHIPGIDADAAHFDWVNEGFTYRDCFVLASSSGGIQRLLLLFQKNERDETPVPCPTCRTSEVQGNSYPSLGVRSWECQNVLCPDRSKYNRGKRYSFRGLAMQHAIEDGRNEIPVDSVRRFTRDVVTDVDDRELIDMLVRHYSMHDDTIHVHGWRTFDASVLGRKTTHHPLTLNPGEHAFFRGPFFDRYICKPVTRAHLGDNLADPPFQVLHGDSAAVLSRFPDETFDGAVTSPPYYNARDYAQWPNIYCYLHEMFAINSEVFRTLKAGSLYLYNVFDCFDNENTIVLSAMGQRRMLLSAYTADLFRRIGFELLGNIAWDKGDIEGKRGFNAGNFSPYYQAPFNCWEHILVFRKPIAHDAKNKPAVDRMTDGLLGRVLRIPPVLKMVRGENRHGHPAPFPDALPELLVSRLRPGDLVLDPFAGSLTTGRVAERYGIRSVCIEKKEEYCRLGLRMRSAAGPVPRTGRHQLALFDQEPAIASSLSQ